MIVQSLHLHIFLSLCTFLSFTLFLTAQSSRILLDEDFSDWENTVIAYSDPSGDDGVSGIDFGDLRIHDDQDYLYINIEVGSEINLQEQNDIFLYIDTDNDAGTGFSTNGIGADLYYAFGDRNGMVFDNGNDRVISHSDIGLVTSPTVSSNQFELAIRKNLFFFGNLLFKGDDIHILFRDNSPGGDFLPDHPGGIDYTFTNEVPGPLPAYSIQRPNPALIRTLSYNVLSDGLFDNIRGPKIGRLLDAINPQIIGFQEIYSHSSAEVANAVEQYLPSFPGQQWYHAKQEPDIHAISRYPILESYLIEGVNPGSGNGAFLIDLEPVYDSDLLLIVAHPPCCGNNSGRQLELDAMMAFLRDAMNGTGPLQLEDNTPIIIMGDMNLVGFNRQVKTLLEGDIFDEGSYGSDFSPDWDNTALEDARPYVTGLPMTFTWYSEFESFSPGRLDYIVYSGSRLKLQNAYSLFTKSLDQETLTDFQLMQQDANTASDHLPLVADFELKPPTPSTELTSFGFRLDAIKPNPAVENSTVYFELAKTAKISISICDLLGRTQLQLVEAVRTPGKHEVSIDVSSIAPGHYTLLLEVEGAVLSDQLIVIR